MPKKKGIVKKVFLIIFLALVLLCAFDIIRVKIYAKQIPHRYASSDEAREMIRSNTAYFGNLTQNDIEYRMQKTGASLDELTEAAANEVYNFSSIEKFFLDSRLAKMKRKLNKNGYELPPIDEIVFVKTNLETESGADGYTRSTDIYLGTALVNTCTVMGFKEEYSSLAERVLWHELFHCLTRCNPDFRKQMYSIIGFNVNGTDYEIPPTVREYMITNPDVEHHDSYASFVIDGKATDCFTVFVTTKKFEEAQSDFFAYGTTALVPIEGTDTYYTPGQAENFDELFGRNTKYVIDPEECMADNFQLAMQYGINGENGQGYASPEIIRGIIDAVSR